jgi:SAM-dependent methyltransferase
MNSYWELKFKNEGAVWSFEPSDSAICALELFKRNNLTSILIPGIGYGRNARLFLDSGCNVTGIEISRSAIETAKINNLDCIIHHGSVTSMPFDDNIYDAVFCYALIHLLNKPERQRLLKSCFNQLKDNGLMIFVVTSKKTDSYGKGRCLSKDRYETESGLKIFFYDPDSIVKEFAPFGLIDFKEIDEPVKFMKEHDPLTLYFVLCKKLTV